MMQTTEQQKGQRSGYRVVFEPVPVTAKKLQRLTLLQLALLHDLANASSRVGPDPGATEASAALYLKGWIRPGRTTGDRQHWRLVITFSDEQLNVIQELINQKRNTKR